MPRPSSPTAEAAPTGAQARRAGTRWPPVFSSVNRCEGVATPMAPSIAPAPSRCAERPCSGPQAGAGRPCRIPRSSDRNYRAVTARRSGRYGLTDDLGSAAKGPRCSLRGDNMKGGGVIAASHPANWPRWSHAGHVHRQHPDLADPQRPRPIWPPHLLIDSVEIKGEGEGETLEVRAVELTSSDIGDALTLPNCKAKSDQISTSPQSPPTVPTARASAMMLSPNEG